jgi:hypothetical protein
MTVRVFQLELALAPGAGHWPIQPRARLLVIERLQPGRRAGRRGTAGSNYSLPEPKTKA